MFQFPGSPTIGQIFSPIAGVSYQWNGTGWAMFAAGALTRSEAAATYIPLTQRGAANGVATLDANGILPDAQDSQTDAIAMAIALG
jgi:hypothetical protein